MKKTISCLLGCCLLLLCACGQPQGKLVREDFHVFQGGKPVLKLDASREFFSYAYDAATLGLDAQLLETRRGTRIGTTMQQLAEQYAGIPCMVFSEAMEKEDLARFADIQLADHLDELGRYSELILVYDMWEHNGLPVYLRDEFTKMVREKKITSSDQVYYLDIMLFIKDGNVSNISLAVKDIRQMLEEYMV